jgi:hypothetical protein
VARASATEPLGVVESGAGIVKPGTAPLLTGEGTFEFDDAFVVSNQVWLEEAGVTPLSIGVTSGADAAVWTSSASSHVFQVDLPNQTGMFVPEPATALLFAAGLVGLAAGRRRSGI